MKIQWKVAETTTMQALACLALACLAPAAAAETNAPSQPAALVVNAVEQSYLYADSAAWTTARGALLRNPSAASPAEFARIERILSEVHDSELHLINTAQLAVINDESNANGRSVGLMDFAIDWDPASGAPRVVTPRIGSPAARAGIRPRDLIVEVNGRSTAGMTHEEVLDLIRQGEKAPLVLRFRRGSRTRTVRLSAAAPAVPVASEMKRTGRERVGYIRITQFTANTGELVRAAIVPMETASPDGYVLDLRNNPGGFLGAAVKVISLFTSGPLGLKVRRGGASEAISSEGQALTTRPVAILINGGTASAAEFVAAILQDRHRAVLVGEPSYGRGQAQVYTPLENGLGISIPSTLLETLSGQSFKGKGISPDVVVSQPMLLVAKLASNRDRQYKAAAAGLANSGRRAGYGVARTAPFRPAATSVNPNCRA